MVNYLVSVDSETKELPDAVKNALPFNPQTVVDARVDGGSVWLVRDNESEIPLGDLRGPAGADGANVLPTQEAVANALSEPGSISNDTLRAEVADVLPAEVNEYLGTGEYVVGAVNIALGGVRRTGVPLTLAGDVSSVDTATAVHGRHPFKLASPVNRFRIHVRNFNDTTNTPFTGALAFTGIWFGRHAVDADGLTGKFDGAPTRIATAFSTAADGAEWVSGWIDRTTAQIDAYSEYLLSYAYTGAAQNNARQLGGGWRSTATSEASSAVPATAMTKSQQMPLDIWIEVEIPASTPIGSYGPGDSLTAATGASLPVYDSFAMKHALANGIVPMILANHGSNAGQWTNPAQQKWAKYAGLDKPDFALITIMSNDIFGGSAVSFDTAKARFAAVVALVRAQLSKNVFVTTILPRNGSASDREAVRVLYNDWLRQLPAGVVNIFDLAASIQGATESTIDSRYNSGDGIHLNTAGYARNASAITQPMARVALNSTLIVPPGSAPTASFTYSAAGLTVTFDGTPSSDIDGTVTAWSWVFGDGGTGTGSTASHTYTGPGTYSVSLVVTDNQGHQSVAAVQTIPVVPALAALPIAGATRRYVASQIPKGVGEDVTSWNDSAGSGVPLTVSGGGLTTATPPSIYVDGGRRYVAFDGVLDGLGSALVAAQPMTMVLVGRIRNIKPGTNNVMLGGGVNLFYSGSLTKWQLNAGAGLNNPVVPDTNPHVWVGVANGGSSSLLVDTRVTGAGGAGSKTALVVGQLPGSPTELDVLEVIFYPSALSTTDQDTLWSALKTQYSIS